ncbi:MAG: polyisoprenyl-phosphate glycosyltransferase [Candidatus Atribacteria bacterium]|nr:polyisoprenyl-phosphate glycosyltransferase [Candidatus Atribacteria bacterium]
MKNRIDFSVVIPVYNEEEVLPETYKRMKQVMGSASGNYELIFVNDGSQDKSRQILENLAQEDKAVRVINFSRNFGHQIAITAGVDYAQGQAVVVIDADLQDPPEVILTMIEKWEEGYEVVYGKRAKREGESFFKKFTASFFYRLLKKATSVDIPVDTGDFRLMDKKVVDVLRLLREKNRFVRGLVSWVGFRQTSVEYVREKRWAGESKYPLRKMLKLAWDGITSFSDKPLKIATYVGIPLSLFSLVLFLVVLFQYLGGKNTFYASSLIGALNLLVSGIVLLALGIIGEYIGRIYEEAKGRPLYIVENTIGFEKEGEESDD